MADCWVLGCKFTKFRRRVKARRVRDFLTVVLKNYPRGHGAPEGWLVMRGVVETLWRGGSAYPAIAERRPEF